MRHQTIDIGDLYHVILTLNFHCVLILANYVYFQHHIVNSNNNKWIEIYYALLSIIL